MSESQKSTVEQVPLEGSGAQGDDKSIQVQPKVSSQQKGGDLSPLDLNAQAPVVKPKQGRHESWFTRARAGRKIVAADSTPSVLRNPSRRQLESTDELFGPNASRSARPILVAKVTWSYSPLYAMVRRNWVKTVRALSRAMYLAGGKSCITQEQLCKVLLDDLEARRARVRKRHAHDLETLEREKKNLQDLGLEISSMAMGQISEEYPYESPISQQTLLLLKEIDAWAYTRGQVCALGVYGPKTVMHNTVKKQLLEPYYEHLILTYDLCDRVKQFDADLKAAEMKQALEASGSKVLDGQPTEPLDLSAAPIEPHASVDAHPVEDALSTTAGDEAPTSFCEFGQQAA